MKRSQGEFLPFMQHTSHFTCFAFTGYLLVQIAWLMLCPLSLPFIVFQYICGFFFLCMGTITAHVMRVFYFRILAIELLISKPNVARLRVVWQPFVTFMSTFMQIDISQEQSPAIRPCPVLKLCCFRLATVRRVFSISFSCFPTLLLFLSPSPAPKYRTLHANKHLARRKSNRGKGASAKKIIKNLFSGSPKNTQSV